MPLPGAAHDSNDPADGSFRPIGLGASPLVMLAAVVTLLATIAAVRTWFVHRPPLQERLIEAQAAVADDPPLIVRAIEALGERADLDATADLLEWVPVDAETWRVRYAGPARILGPAVVAESALLDGLAPAAADAVRAGTGWDQLSSAARTQAAASGLDRETWMARIADWAAGPGSETVADARTALGSLGGDDAVRSVVRLATSAGEAGRNRVPDGLDELGILSGRRFSTVAADVRDRDEARDLARRLPRRMLALTVVVLLAWFFVRRDQRMSRRSQDPASAPTTAGRGGSRRRSTPSEIRAAVAMISTAGVILLASRLLVQSGVRGSVEWGLLEIIALHAAAAVIIRWRDLKASVVGPVLLILLWDLLFLLPGVVEGMGLVDRVVVAILSPAALVPGIALTEWRLRARADRAERDALGRRVAFADDELSRARIVHDAMFPAPFQDAVAFDYHYEPIHEIGGDYVHVHRCGRTGRVVVTLLDVAGHGLAAALTVNRLFGELERILAEDEAAPPSQIMDLLNRYIHLTMARHSLFATGTCMAVDPSVGELRWVSAGHPPSMLRHADGSVEELITTTMLLGALPPGEFESIEECRGMTPGDVVIAYTDGAMEARDASGRQFGIEGLRHLAEFDTPPRSWSTFIAHAVEAHHRGRAEDDVLIATLALRGLRIDGSGG